MDPHDNIANLWASAWEEPMTDNRYAFLRQSPIYGPSVRDNFPPEPEDQPENSCMVGGEEYMTVAEWLRRLDPIYYPSAKALVSASGTDRTYQVLGKKAAERGRSMGITPAKLYHPSYDEVNGWPARIIQDAWSRFKMEYTVEWRERDPEPPAIPEPVKMPAPEYNPKLWQQVRDAAERRGVHYSHTRDPRWRGAFAMLLAERPDETPEQAMVRRTSAAGAMFAIEKEHQR